MIRKRGRDARFCRPRFYRAIRNISGEVSIKRGNSLWTAYGDKGSRDDSLTYFEVGGENISRKVWVDDDPREERRKCFIASFRGTLCFALVNAARRKMRPGLPASLLALGYRATSISGSSVNPPFARLDVYVSYDFSTIARLHRFDGSFGLRTRSFYLRPSFIRVICGMSRPRVIYADITCNKWIQRRSRDFIKGFKTDQTNSFIGESV